ncbi:MAG TPA: DUF4139 domain-containing protein [Candidatus Hydrogenedentes bacterium]|jgi:hypothetical protein|nr:DUF4139 domain-containing protein [Candidatus Hydrogenedentota bacterium]HOM47842.1 DUF4139 domain-containing protein [Candidatus Hydrogenedentota bacterium]HOR50123.1 DUF4139 domain-containing protein [Candidatus Hydrogenedentota bacterium]HPK24180.1 DUF4139 domain-containing protein [Candidatus Hydrogenedentota bacterium]HPX85391.1 DUF4139 domain-containing protein [Candidatus Hydrogenedentota bacterium]
MKAPHIILFLFTALILSGVSAEAQASDSLKLSDPVAEKVASGQTTLSDQTDVAITIYNNDRALIRDRRKIRLLPGEAALRFMDVASTILPETVSLRSLNDPGALKILEQNYEYDLMSPDKLMEKYVGRNVTLINKNTDYSFYEQPAKLLSVNNGPVYEVDGKIYLGHPGVVVLPEIPEALIAKPTLVWLLSNDATDHEVEASYLAGGISWRADYVLTVGKDEKTMDLEGWVTLDNQSGATYNNAQLKLVAGDVNIAAPAPVMYREAKAMDMMMAGAPPMMEESFSEYHLYALQRRTTIKEKQTKQVSLLSGKGIKISKKYEFRGNLAFYSSRLDAQKNQNADAFIVFENKEENGLGIPLPAGIMRVYQPDSSGMLQFSGEDRISHTPKNEEVRLILGKAFDVVGDRTQKDYKNLGPNTHEVEFELSIRNRKDTAIQLDVVEPMPGGDWQILKQSHAFVKKDARTAVFTVDIPADSEVTVNYRVRVNY